MAKRLLLILCFSLFALSAVFSQEATVKIALETDHFLFGQTVWAKYTITNASESPIYLAGIESHGQFTLLKRDAKAFYPDGKEVPQYKGEEMVVGNRSTPKKMLASGESIIWSLPVPVTDVSIDKLPPGRYKLVFCFDYSLTDKENIFEKKCEAATTFIIDTPEGADAAWLHDIKEAKKTLYQKDPSKVALGQPLIWGDVLDCAFCPPGLYDIRPELLEKFPTSTYAGYELCKGGPSLKRAAEIDDAKRDMDWAVPMGASPEDQQKRRETMKKGYEEYAAKVGNFLKAHPDFVNVDRLRYNLAVFLLYLDRRGEATGQLETLAKMESPLADEAKAAIETINCNKKVETSMPKALSKEASK